MSLLDSERTAAGEEGATKNRDIRIDFNLGRNQQCAQGAADGGPCDCLVSEPSTLTVVSSSRHDR